MPRARRCSSGARSSTSVWAVSAGRLVASTGMLVIDVQVAQQRFPVVGIGGVIVAAAYRGRGVWRGRWWRRRWSGRALSVPTASRCCSAMEWLDLVYYRRLGFADIDLPVEAMQPDGYEVIPQRTMWRALQDDVSWPPGPVVVHSLPF